MGLGSRGRGVPGVPSLVFLERLNGKRLADGRPPVQHRGPEVLAPPPPELPTLSRITRIAVLLGAQLQCTSLAVPILGGNKSANCSPPLG